jgi:hypothetical protein
MCVSNPVIGCFQVGDIIEVVLMNKASRPYSIVPHGVLYEQTMEGETYGTKSSFLQDGAVAPGASYIYRWLVPERAGPGPHEPNCVGWIYHSGTDVIKDTYSGLMGPLVTCRPGTLDNRGDRVDEVDHEYAVLFIELNENESWYFEENVATFAPNRIDLTDPDFDEGNVKSGINGFIYNNVPGLSMRVGERVAWYVLSMGGVDDAHTAHWHGQTVLLRSDSAHRADVIEVFPGTYETVEMMADNPGRWLLHCHVAEHMSNGMSATYNVAPKRGDDDDDDDDDNTSGVGHLSLTLSIVHAIALFTNYIHLYDIYSL